MVIDGIGNFVRLALRPRIKPADNALELRKLANHLCGEIALGKFRRAVRFSHMRLVHAEIEPLLRQPARDIAHTFHFIAIAAQAGFVGNALQLGKIVGEPTFLVGLPEEARVGEPGSQDPLVPCADKALGVFVGIDDRQKLRRKFSILLFHGEVLLVVAHDGDENLVGQAEERGIELALDDRRMLVEINHQSAQARILMNTVVAALGKGLQFLADFFLAPGRANDYPVRVQLLFVIEKVAHTNASRTEKPMARGGIVGGNPRHPEPQRLAVENRYHPPNRTNEAGAGKAGPRHGSRPAQIVNRPRKNRRQNLFGSAADLDLFDGQMLALGSFDQVDGAHRHALLFGEAERGACRRADRIIGHRFGRAGDFQLDIRLLRRQPANPRRQAPRSAKSLDRYVFGKVFGGKELFEIAAKFFFRLGQHPGRNFFAAYFEEQLEGLLLGSRLHARTPAAVSAPPSC